ncbi:hypothetical protein LJR251_002773 [Rhizobium rhizogenes]|uniref:hypothetical protein n=1 Tax=Rhizobium rhizogenes TaxID=359 RepID=UPI003ED11BF5
MTTGKFNEYEDGEALVVAEGTHARVLLVGEARTEYEALCKRTDQTSIQEARTLGRYFDRFAASGGDCLDSRMYKNVGRRKVGGSDVLVHEFKSYQFRIYGVAGTFKGKSCFVGTACDPKKKKDKADPGKLEKAAKEWVRVKDGEKN